MKESFNASLNETMNMHSKEYESLRETIEAEKNHIQKQIQDKDSTILNYEEIINKQKEAIEIYK